MQYFKIVLCTIAALLLAEFVQVSWTFKGISQEKATGLVAVAGGFVESLLSPLFWISAAMSFGIFHAASQAKNTALQTIFFWIPTSILSSIALTFMTLFAYVLVKASQAR